MEAMRPRTAGAPLAAGLAAWMAIAGGAHAQTAESASALTTGDLATACLEENGAGTRGADFCEGFILGTGLFYKELLEAGVIEAWACTDPVPTLAQIRDDFLAWVQANPAHEPEPAIDGFWRAMAATYPCAATTRAE